MQPNMQFSQAGRPMRIETIFPPNTFLLEEFEFVEAISEPYMMRCRVLCQVSNVDADSLLQTGIRVTMHMHDWSERYFHGVVRAVRLAGKTKRFLIYEFDASHELWFLSLNTDCRIWQEASVPGIVRQVFSRYSTLNHEWKTSRDYPEREYCVQYRESDLAYVSRLLEAEGVYYFFRHSDDKATLVLADTRGSIKPCRATAIEFDPRQTSMLKEDVIATLERRSVAHTKKFALNDYNYLNPRADLIVDAGEKPSPQHFDYPGKYKTAKEGERYASFRFEAELAMQTVFTGTSDCRDMQAGTSFDLSRHQSTGLNNDKYTLTRVRHFATDDSYIVAADNGVFRYENTFSAIPEALTYRKPQWTPRPVVPGSQTALVVGLEMDKPYTEEHSRVKLHFYWDRYGRKDGTDSCWVRVSQPWAGRNWGAISIPRVGQEVIVDFLEGDPDRPIITGRVYNADMTPPYALRAGDVKMGFKSRSIGGMGYNEISIDDTNADEGITIHAQKDMSTVVENNETIEIRNCRTEKVVVDEKITIGNNRTEEVVANERVHIGANRTEQVAANESITIGNNRETTVGSNEILTVQMTRTQSVGINEMINVGAAQELTVGGLRMVTVGVAQVINVGKKHTVNAGNQIALSAPKIVLEASEEIKISCGGGSITIDSGGNITIKGTLVKINC